MTKDGVFHVGEWQVDSHLNVVSAQGTEVRLEPKAMQVLSYLAERAGRVIPKEELLGEIWGDTCVTEDVLPNCIWELRKALGDDARRPRFIQTLPKKGYRLIAPVSTAFERGKEQESAETAGRRNTYFVALPAPIRAHARLLLMLFLVGALGVFVWALRLDSRGTPGLLADKHPSSRSIAVLSFQNHTQKPDLVWLSSGLPSMLETGLAEGSDLEVVSRHRVESALSEMGVADRARPVSNDETLALANRIGAGTIVTGSVFRIGSELRVDVQITDVPGGTILAAHTERGEDVFELADHLTAKIRASLNISNDPETAGISAVTTASLDAYRLYSEGVEARRHMRLDDARDLLGQALGLDPSFALAQWELRSLGKLTDMRGRSESDRAELEEIQERLPERKRALARAESIARRNPEEAVALLEGLIERYPDEEDAPVALYHVLTTRHEPEKALSVLSRAVARQPWSGLLRLHYGYALMRSARYAEAIQQFRSYARIHPVEANPYDSLGEAYLMAGLPDHALRQYERALQTDPDFRLSRAGRAWAFATKGDYPEALSELDALGDELPTYPRLAFSFFMKGYLLSRAGYLEEAERVLAEGMEVAEKTENTYFQGAIALLTVLIDLENGELASAVDRARAVRSLLAPDGAQDDTSRKALAVTFLLEGVAEARAGNVEAAGRRLKSLEETHQPRSVNERAWYHLLEGEIAYAEGDYAAAAATFARGEPAPRSAFNSILPVENVFANPSLRDGRARSFAAGGDVAAAVEAYESLVTPDLSQKWTAPLEPRHLLELSRLLERADRAEEAQVQYERLVRVMSLAPPDHPILVEAGGALARR